MFSVQLDLIHITPAPVLARLDRLHNGVLTSVKMFRGVFVLGGIAASDMAADQA
jgi:hypothetical protein